MTPRKIKKVLLNSFYWIILLLKTIVGTINSWFVISKPMENGVIKVHPLSNNPTAVWKEISKTQKIQVIIPQVPTEPVRPDMVRFVCMSDTHSELHKISFHIPFGDVYIHAGDFTRSGEKEEIIRFSQWLKALPHKYKIVICGNHELSFDRKFSTISQKPPNEYNTPNLPNGFIHNIPNLTGLNNYANAPRPNYPGHNYPYGPGNNPNGSQNHPNLPYFNPRCNNLYGPEYFNNRYGPGYGSGSNYPGNNYPNGLYDPRYNNLYGPGYYDNKYGPGYGCGPYNGQALVYKYGYTQNNTNLFNNGSNYATNYTPNVSRMENLRNYLTNCIYLEDTGVQIYGIKIYGTPWQPEFRGYRAFQLKRGIECLNKWNLIPGDTDILVTHTPPLGYGDLTSMGLRAGCVELLATVQQRVNPKYHVFGHIHEAYGMFSDGKITYINASTCSTSYVPKNLPIVFDVPLPKGEKKV